MGRPKILWRSGFLEVQRGRDRIKLKAHVTLLDWQSMTGFDIRPSSRLHNEDPSTTLSAASLEETLKDAKPIMHAYSGR